MRFWSLLVLLTAGCTGTVVDPGGTVTGSTVTAGSAPWTPPAGGPLYGVTQTGGPETGYDVTVNRIDTSTGLYTEIVGFGDVPGWSQDPVIDETGTHVLTVGSTSQGMVVYTADLVAATSTAVPLLANAYGDNYFGYRLAGVTQGGSLLAISRTDTTESVFLIDPTAGVSTLLGEIAPLSSAFGGTATYDHVAHVVYLVNGYSPAYLYSYSLDTMTSASVPVTSLPSDFVVLAGVLPGGNVVGAFWDVATSVARVVEIDPATGAATSAGQLGDLAGWHTSASLNAGVVRSYGAAGPGGQEPQQQLYALDLATHASAKVPVSEMFAIARY